MLTEDLRILEAAIRLRAGEGLAQISTGLWAGAETYPRAQILRRRLNRDEVRAAARRCGMLPASGHPASRRPRPNGMAPYPRPCPRAGPPIVIPRGRRIVLIGTPAERRTIGVSQ